MLTIKDKDVVNGLYVGRHLTSEDAVIVPATIKHIRFASGTNIKALMTGSGVRIDCGEEIRIRHVKLGGVGVFAGNLFCGSVETTGSIIVGGDLVSWLGDITSQDGSIIANGAIISAGRVLAKNGAIVCHSVKAEERIFSLNTWAKGSGDKIAGIAAMALDEAKTFKGDLKL